MKTRLNLAINRSVKHKMELLKKSLNADSLTEVVRRSIDVFEWIVNEQSKGNKLQIKHEDGSIEEMVIV